jgi:hypothetical protein
MAARQAKPTVVRNKRAAFEGAAVAVRFMMQESLVEIRPA